MCARHFVVCMDLRRSLSSRHLAGDRYYHSSNKTLTGSVSSCTSRAGRYRRHREVPLLRLLRVVFLLLVVFLLRPHRSGLWQWQSNCHHYMQWHTLR